MSTDQPKGKFVAYINKDKQPGDKLPAFDQGELHMPGTDDVRTVTLWIQEYTDKETGEVKQRYSGEAKPILADPKAHLAKLAGPAVPTDAVEFQGATYKAHQIRLYPNKFQAEAPDKPRPDLHGHYYPGNGAPLVSLGVWIETTRYGDVKLSGKTGYPVPGKPETVMQDDMAADHAEPAPKKSGRGKATGGRGE